MKPQAVLLIPLLLFGCLWTAVSFFFLPLSFSHSKDNVLSDSQQTGRQNLRSLSRGFRNISVIAWNLLVDKTCKIAILRPHDLCRWRTHIERRAPYCGILARVIFFFSFVRNEYPPRACLAFIPPKVECSSFFTFTCSYFHYRR